MRGRSAARITNLSSRRAPGASGRWSRLHGRLYRLTGGRFMPRWFGAPVLVLETVGRRTGEPRVTPLVYVREGDDLVVSPSSGATNPNPAWWLNLQAAGEGVVVIGGERRRVRPRVAEGAERERLWGKLCDAYPAMREYVAMLGQDLTVVVLAEVGPLGLEPSPRSASEETSTSVFPFPPREPGGDLLQ